MKKYLLISLIVCGLVIGKFSMCQMPMEPNLPIPNAGFENWSTVELFESPDNWVSGNAEAIFSGSGFDQLTTEKTEDSYSGDYALHIRSIDIDPSASTEVIFGYAMANAYMEFNNDIPTYYGGNPITGNPDSVYGYFKYSIPSSDSAFIIFAGKRDGEIVVEDFFKIAGENEVYSKIGFDINTDTLTSPIDTFIIAITCSHILDEYAATVAGAYVIVDSLWFTGVDDIIPNGNFENWSMLSYEDPDDWWTTNAYHTVFNDTNMIATRSTDSYSGDYAMQLESRYITGTNVILGYATSGFGVFQNGPPFEVNFKPSMLRGYYKYDSPVSDQAYIGITLFGEYEYQQYNFGTLLSDVTEYTEFTIPTLVPSNITVTGAIIHITPGDIIYTSDTYEPGNILLIDDLELVDPCEGIQPEDLFENDDITICEGSTELLDPGDQFMTYSWSTLETTETIVVSEAGAYSVTVTVGLCEISDEIEVITTICDAIDEIPLIEKLNVYPNPTEGKVTIELYSNTENTIKIDVINLVGHKVYSKQFENKGEINDIDLDLSQLKEGIYFIKVIAGEKSYNKKLVIK